MSFQIVLYTNNSPANKINKSKTLLNTFTGTLKQGTSIINPVITIETDSSNIYIANYMEIAQFERFYFIKDIVNVKQNFWEIHAHVDVLESFSPEFMQLSAIVERQENNYNLYLDDGIFKVYQNPIISTVPFPNDFDSPSYILTVAGS